MSRFSIPHWVKENLYEYDGVDGLSEEFYKGVSERFKKFHHPEPVVSVVIPVWNEEKNIAHTIYTLSNIQTNHPAEIIFVNNNSTDRTQELLDRCGVKSIFNPKQGISYTRQMGLENAKGTYYLSADSDSLYPSNWIDSYVDALKDKSVSVAYGPYSFIPPGNTSRFTMGVYEIVSETLFALRRKRRGYLNVMGFNSGYRREDALKIGGYNLNRTIWEDGWMAFQLMKHGKIKFVKDARVWTEARRLMVDGSIWGAVKRRVKKEITRIYEYIFPKKQKID
ncbi:MAG: glycosyltransferase [Ignavibacteria bacterium]|nr:glycosyltransferase [Ignavibacteria bacterium]